MVSLQNNGFASPTSQIKYTYNNLTRPKQKKVLNLLKSSERKTLINIFNGSLKSKDVHIKNERGREKLKELSYISELIKHVEHSPVTVTKKTDKYSTLSKVVKFIEGIWEKVRVFFGYVSSRKTYQEIMKQNNLIISQYSNDENLKPVTKYALKDIIKKAQDASQNSSQASLADLLKEEGYSPIISQVSFGKSIKLNNLDLSGIVFDRCKFYWTPFKNSTLKKVVFSNCKLRYPPMLNTKFEDCLFKNCKIRGAFLLNASLKNVNFEESDLIGCSFEDVSIAGGSFKNVSMPGTHFLQTSFSKINKPKILNSNLEDTIFFGQRIKFAIDKKSLSSHKITRPVTMFLCNPTARGFATPKALSKLELDSGCIPLRLAIHSPSLETEAVNKEVDLLIDEFEEVDKGEKDQLPAMSKVSRGAYIAHKLDEELNGNSSKNTKFPNSQKILQKVKTVTKYVDGIYLTGGEDVPPRLYGEEAAPETVWSGDNRRSVLEFCLIKEAVKKGMPIMGVCRGLQIAEVYFGARLKQHVSGQKWIQKLTSVKNQGIFSDKALFNNILLKKNWYNMMNTVTAGVAHHQAIPAGNSAKEYLEDSIIYSDMVKGAEPKYSGAAPAILVQFHPEFLGAKTARDFSGELHELVMKMALSPGNNIIWKTFQDSINTYNKKKAFLLPEIKSKGIANKSS